MMITMCCCCRCSQCIVAADVHNVLWLQMFTVYCDCRCSQCVVAADVHSVLWLQMFTMCYGCRCCLQCVVAADVHCGREGPARTLPHPACGLSHPHAQQDHCRQPGRVCNFTHLLLCHIRMTISSSTKKH